MATDDEEQLVRWTVHGERPIYDSEWVSVSMADVSQPDGERFDHHVVRMPAASMVVALDDQNRVLLMWRHRFVADRWGWELAGGLIDDGEDPAATAARELEEETGYRAGQVEHLITFQPMVGMLECAHHVYLATDVKYIGEPTEKNEAQNLEWAPLSSVMDLIASGDVWNSGTLVALLYVLARQQQKLLGG